MFSIRFTCFFSRVATFLANILGGRTFLFTSTVQNGATCPTNSGCAKVYYAMHWVNTGIWIISNKAAALISSFRGCPKPRVPCCLSDSASKISRTTFTAIHVCDDLFFAVYWHLWNTFEKAKMMITLINKSSKTGSPPELSMLHSTYMLRFIKLFKLMRTFHFIWPINFKSKNSC